MADVRALLKAKRQEARITHPYAAYNSSGQLRCSVCGSIVKHASAWEGHLGSKLHRTNVARMREEEKRQQEQQEAVLPEPETTGKRKAPLEESEIQVEKKRKVEDQAKARTRTSNEHTDPTEAYDRATVTAEPVLPSAQVPGFPTISPEAVVPEPVKLTDEEVRLKRAQEERELIMDRLLEEERAQEDVDTRVQLLKARLEGLRKKRELAKANKTKVTS
ncbi:hypothetical protein BDZ97DRAFT_1920258 [Flammula alnicola]|nr:hypothetical protein BDZ97DRAFT_1920258 [Flammula alnicola]